MNDDDKKLILANLRYCCTCKHCHAELMHPATNSSSWEDWVNNYEAECRRYPPIFTAKDISRVIEDGTNYHPINFRYPSIYAFTEICGEYVKADWVPS